MKNIINEEKKAQQLLSLPTSTIDMLRIKSSNKGLNLSDYINDLIIGDGESDNINEIDRKIKANEQEYFGLISYINKISRDIKKSIEKITNIYLGKERELEERKKILIDGEVSVGYNDKGLRPIILNLLRNYIEHGKDKTTELISGFASYHNINRWIIKRELGKAIDIYSTYTDEEKEIFKKVTDGGYGGIKSSNELKECELPRGL